MEDVLHAVDHDRLFGACHVQHALDAQDVAAVEAYPHLDPGVEAVPVQRLVVGPAKGADRLVVAVHVMAMMMRGIGGMSSREGFSLQPETRSASCREGVGEYVSVSG